MITFERGVRAFAAVNAATNEISSASSLDVISGEHRNSLQPAAFQHVDFLLTRCVSEGLLLKTRQHLSPTDVSRWETLFINTPFQTGVHFCQTNLKTKSALAPKLRCEGVHHALCHTRDLFRAMCQMNSLGMLGLSVDQPCFIEREDQETLIAAARILEVSESGGVLLCESGEKLLTEAYRAVLVTLNGHRVQRVSVMLFPQSDNSLAVTFSTAMAVNRKQDSHPDSSATLLQNE